MTFYLDVDLHKTQFTVHVRTEEMIEKQLEELSKDDAMVKRLLTIRGCGKIMAWILRAYTEDISCFSKLKEIRGLLRTCS